MSLFDYVTLLFDAKPPLLDQVLDVDSVKFSILGWHAQRKVSFYVAVGMPDNCAFINIAQRLKYGLRSSYIFVAHTAPGRDVKSPHHSTVYRHFHKVNYQNVLKLCKKKNENKIAHTAGFGLPGEVAKSQVPNSPKSPEFHKLC